MRLEVERAGRRTSDSFRYPPCPSTESDLSRPRSPGASAFEDTQPMIVDEKRERERGREKEENPRRIYASKVTKVTNRNVLDVCIRSVCPVWGYFLGVPTTSGEIRWKDFARAGFHSIPSISRIARTFLYIVYI